MPAAGFILPLPANGYRPSEKPSRLSMKKGLELLSKSKRHPMRRRRPARFSPISSPAPCRPQPCSSPASNPRLLPQSARGRPRSLGPSSSDAYRVIGKSSRGRSAAPRSTRTIAASTLASWPKFAIWGIPWPPIPSTILGGRACFSIGGSVPCSRMSPILSLPRLRGADARSRVKAKERNLDAAQRHDDFRT
jgi:hypothetical protein